jgi:nucleoporin SEH1
LAQFSVNSCGVTCISWNPCVYQPPMFVVGANDKSGFEAGARPTTERQRGDELLMVWMYSQKKNSYEPLVKFESEGHSKTITDVAWAPLMGRSYHVIASASKDCRVILWRLDLTCLEETDVEFHSISTLAGLPFTCIVCLIADRP